MFWMMYTQRLTTLLQADSLSSIVLGCLSLCDVFACMSSVLYHSALLSEQPFNMFQMSFHLKTSARLSDGEAVLTL